MAGCHGYQATAAIRLKSAPYKNLGKYLSVQVHIFQIQGE